MTGKLVPACTTREDGTPGEKGWESLYYLFHLSPSLLVLKCLTAAGHFDVHLEGRKNAKKKRS